VISLRRWVRVVGTLIVFAPEVLLAQDPSIVAPGAKLERLFDEGFFTEGPTQAPDGSVYFSDITVGKASGNQAGHIWRWDPRTRTTAVFRSPSGMSNGMVFDGQGRLVVAEGAAFGGRRITRTDMKTGKSVILAALFDGRPFNSPNDLVLDARGRIYFTDPRYVGWEPIEQPVQGVYRIDLDGRVSLIVADAGKPNGIAVSPDQATLYVAAHDNGSLGDLPPEIQAAPGRKALLAYDLAPDGSAKFRRAVVDFLSGRARWDRRGPGRQHLLRGAGGAPGHLCLLSGREGAGLHPDVREPHEREVRPRRGCADAIHHRGEESVPDSGGTDWVRRSPVSDQWLIAKNHAPMTGPRGGRAPGCGGGAPGAGAGAGPYSG